MKPLRLFILLFLLGCMAELKAENAPSAALSIPGSDYRIAARDTVEFKIYNQIDMETLQRVTSTGEIRLPLIGTVNLAGFTLREAEHMLEKLFRDGGFFVDPQVILSVKQYGDRYVSVLGQVKNPERIALASETNAIGILQAITQVGGFTRVARIDAVQVLRTSASGQDERLTVNMEDVLRPKTGTPAQEFQLRSGDIVFVPERVF